MKTPTRSPASASVPPLGSPSPGAPAAPALRSPVRQVFLVAARATLRFGTDQPPERPDALPARPDPPPKGATTSAASCSRNHHQVPDFGPASCDLAELHMRACRTGRRRGGGAGARPGGVPRMPTRLAGQPGHVLHGEGRFERRSTPSRRPPGLGSDDARHRAEHGRGPGHDGSVRRVPGGVREGRLGPARMPTATWRCWRRRGKTSRGPRKSSPWRRAWTRGRQKHEPEPLPKAY